MSDHSKASAELQEEVDVIEAIFGENVFRYCQSNHYILRLSSCPIALILNFPISYPDHPPEISGIETVGNEVWKGFGTHVMNHAKNILVGVWRPGEVCMFPFIQELESFLDDDCGGEIKRPNPKLHQTLSAESEEPCSAALLPPIPPKWSLSAPIIEKKSLFLARACTVSSPAHASACIAHLLSTDKKCAKANHNITAFRVRTSSKEPKPGQVVYQDCNDDGETAAGSRLLHLLQVMDVWNVLVVVTRWYGGVKLGPDRFRIISNAARDALVKGGWQHASKEKIKAGQRTE